CAMSFVRSRGLGKVFLDQPELMRPTTLVRREGLGAARERNPVETGLGDGEERAARCVLELEDDEGGRLVRIVYRPVDSVRMPAEREEAHRLDALDKEVEGETGERLLHSRHLRIHLRGCDPTGDPRAGREVTVELDAEPVAELLRLADCSPEDRKSVV